MKLTHIRYGVTSIGFEGEKNAYCGIKIYQQSYIMCRGVVFSGDIDNLTWGFW
jgi:hypothetical protein